MTTAAPGGRQLASSNRLTTKVANPAANCKHDATWTVPPDQAAGANCGTCGAWLTRWDLVDILATDRRPEARAA
jgi:hypothetical protein